MHPILLLISQPWIPGLPTGLQEVTLTALENAREEALKPYLDRFAGD